MRPPAPKPPVATSSYNQQERRLPRPENPLLLLRSSRAAKLSVGCPILDRLLSGGLPAASITEIVGESAAGKTQLCLQLALLAPLSPLSSSSLFLYSDLPFPLRRLRLLAPKSRPDLLDHVLVAAVHSPSDLLALLSRAQYHLTHPSHSPHRLPIRLILLDSIASLFRADFDASPRDLKRRSGLFFKISAKLKELAYRHQCVVVVTNQVVDVMEGDTGNTVAWSSGRRVSPALGLSWANCVNTRLFLTREVDSDGGSARRHMKVAFAPHLPERTCEFAIRRDGVFGVEPAERNNIDGACNQFTQVDGPWYPLVIAFYVSPALVMLSIQHSLCISHISRIIYITNYVKFPARQHLPCLNADEPREEQPLASLLPPCNCLSIPFLGVPDSMDIQMNNDELNLNLSLRPSYPPRLPTAFLCCYCFEKFQSSRALLGHQNEYKLQLNLAKRSQKAAIIISQGYGENVGMVDGSSALSTVLGCEVSSGKKHHEHVWPVLQGCG